jgi:hypothetical protein
MATVRDLSGNAEFVDSHISTPSSVVFDTSALATQATLVDALGKLNTIDSNISEMNNDSTPVTVTAGPPTSVAGLIANGESLSASIQVDGKITGIVMPAAWTTAALTFQHSIDDSTFYNITDEDGVERSISSTIMGNSVGELVTLDLIDWLPAGYIKLRSGTSGTPVNQGADRTFGVILAG